MTILLIDVPNIAWRAFHTSQAFDDKVQGVLFGVFRTLLELQKRFQTERMAFCFDGSGSKRKELYPFYKSSRSNPTDPMKGQERRTVKEAMGKVVGYLSKIGYENAFAVPSFEADDLIASIIDEQNDKDFVTVSSDTDLYQLIGDTDGSMWGQHMQYLPVHKVVYNETAFHKEFCNLSPTQWPEIKAIAGCKTDDIPGVPGVGNKTAAKFLAGQLSKNSKAYKAIVDNAHIKMANLPLVKLPFSGCPALKLVEDKPTRKGWAKVLKELGMSDLLGGF